MMYILWKNILKKIFFENELVEVENSRLFNSHWKLLGEILQNHKFQLQQARLSLLKMRKYCNCFFYLLRLCLYIWLRYLFSSDERLSVSSDPPSGKTIDFRNPVQDTLQEWQTSLYFHDFSSEK